MSHANVQLPTDITLPPTSKWAKLPMTGGIIGALGLITTLAMTGGEHKDRAMFSYLWAYEFGLSIALGALGWILIDLVCRTAWSAVLKRIIETTAVTLPLFAVLWVPIGLIGLHAIYPWTHENDEILARKRWFLTEGFWFTRAGIYLAVWVALSLFFYNSSVKQDSLGHDLAARDKVVRRMWMVAGPGLFLWAFTLSFQAIDWMMSLAPHWYSTIFGVYYFAGSLLSFFAFTSLVTMGLQKAGVLKTAVTAEHFHDLGKLVFGYTVFWAYIAFSQLILIWYANIPEETIFYLQRLQGGWEWVSYGLPVAHFAVPFFFLLSRYMKRGRMALAIGCTWVLVMHAVDLYWLILPNYGAHGGHGPHFAIMFTDFTALIGVAGAFFAVFGYFLRKNKVVGVNDPRLSESLAHENF